MEYVRAIPQHPIYLPQVRIDRFGESGCHSHLRLSRADGCVLSSQRFKGISGRIEIAAPRAQLREMADCRSPAVWCKARGEHRYSYHWATTGKSFADSVSRVRAPELERDFTVSDSYQTDLESDESSGQFPRKSALEIIDTTVANIWAAAFVLLLVFIFVCLLVIGPGLVG